MEKLALPLKEGLVFHDLKDIVRFEAQKGYTSVYLQSGQKLLSSQSIKEYEDILPESVFYRIHNAHLVNLNFVLKYHKGRGGNIEMSDGTMLEVATRRKDELLARFGYKGM
jgi:two-component system LytT family response regulator